MARLPVISGYELSKILNKHFGFRVLRQKGSHIALTNDLVFITVPLHDELDKGTLNAILKDANVSREEFLKYV